MKLATTTADFTRYCSTIEDCIKNVAEAGFKYVDLSLYEENEPTSLFMQDGWREYTLKLKSLAEELGVEFVQAHAPDVNALCFDSKWDFSLRAVKRSVEVCGLLGIPNTVLHSGWASGIGKEQYFEKNMKFFAPVLRVAEENGVNVCIENSTRANTGDNYFFYTGEDMLEFIKYVDHPNIKACWDTGHANIEGHQYADLVALGGENLTAVHIHDNHGTRDEHLLPYMGTMSLDEIMHGLIDADYRGYFTFECDSSITFPDYWLFKRNGFSDNRLAQPQLFMQKELEGLKYRMGEYTLKKYGCFED